MDLSDIIAVSGKPGLYRVVSQSRASLIVESLEDGKRLPVHSIQKVSALADISIYTLQGDKPLSEVYQEFYKFTEGDKAPHHNSSEEDLREFMDRALPQYDEDRVYQSDLKKLFKWYNLLHDKDMIDLEEKDSGENGEKKEDSTEDDATTDQS